jgi:uncharacterized protein (DUF1697 family)
MPRYIAFLRAINVGGHVVKMDRLRALFEEIGFKDVETFIASGQVIFETRTAAADKLEARIEKHLRGALGYEVGTFIRTLKELEEIAAAAPDGDGTLYVFFTHKKIVAAAQKKLMGYASEVDSFAVRGREIYWRSTRGFSGSQFTGALLEKTIGMPATARNINTVHRLIAKYGHDQ